MSAYWGTEDHVTPAINVANMTSAAAVFQPGKPADVKRVVVVVTTANTAQATGTVAVRDADGSSNSTTLGTFVIPANPDANTAFYVEIAHVDPDGETAVSQPAEVTTGPVDVMQTNSPGVARVAVGQEIAVTFSGGTTGVADVYYEYVEIGQILGDLTQAVFTPA